MPRIVWSFKWETLIQSLHSGVSVKDTASKLNVSYSTLCKYLSSLSMDNKGQFKERIHASDNLKDFFENFVLANYPQIPLITEAFGASPSQVQTLMRTFALRKEWDFSNSTAENAALGRKAELFIKEQPEFRIVADMIKKNSKAPYDLVVTPDQSIFNHWNNIEKIGAVDVKATKLRTTRSGTKRFKFNISNISRPTKYIFALGYDENYEAPAILLIIPFKLLQGKKSISVSLEGIADSHWFPWVYKIYDNFRVPFSNDIKELVSSRISSS